MALFEEAGIPWKDIAFRTVGLTLRHWVADRARGAFAFRARTSPAALGYSSPGWRDRAAPTKGRVA